MKIIALAALSLALLCGGCASITGLDVPSNLKTDPLALAQSSVVLPTTSLKLTNDDVAVFSRMHDMAISRCLYFRNKQQALFTIGSMTITNSDLMLATIAPAAVIAGAKAPETAVVAGLSTLFANQLKSFVGFPTPGSDYTSVVASMDYIYNTYTSSPGIASMMNDTATGQPLRTEAVKEYRIALEQICISQLKMPTTTASVYQTNTAAKAAPTTTTTTTPSQ